MRTVYRLPSGQDTFSAAKYTRAWRAFAKPLCKALGGELVAFDPCVTLAIKGRKSTVQFDRDMVHRLTAIVQRSLQVGE